ncbi:hypothetical protein ATL40_1462 [Serinibacter salmoneus]|uniref:Uncharacterized protein n=1 Tax=Serinibacter salmoneus TaxID=556530 RepID=A0A2A9D0H4_9MICO|nr:hypothetical protein ATL40_1462 [Serinibacter salmoneus]
MATQTDVDGVWLCDCGCEHTAETAAVECSEQCATDQDTCRQITHHRRP